MQNPIYKVIESENERLTKQAKKCDECEEKETCTEYHPGWVCTYDE